MSNKDCYNCCRSFCISLTLCCEELCYCCCNENGCCKIWYRENCQCDLCKKRTEGPISTEPSREIGTTTTTEDVTVHMAQPAQGASAGFVDIELGESSRPRQTRSQESMEPALTNLDAGLTRIKLKDEGAGLESPSIIVHKESSSSSERTKREDIFEEVDLPLQPLRATAEIKAAEAKLDLKSPPADKATASTQTHYRYIDDDTPSDEIIENVLLPMTMQSRKLKATDKASCSKIKSPPLVLPSTSAGYRDNRPPTKITNHPKQGPVFAFDSPSDSLDKVTPIFEFPQVGGTSSRSGVTVDESSGQAIAFGCPLDNLEKITPIYETPQVENSGSKSDQIIDESSGSDYYDSRHQDSTASAKSSALKHTSELEPLLIATSSTSRDTTVTTVSSSRNTSSDVSSSIFGPVSETPAYPPVIVEEAAAEEGGQVTGEASESFEVDRRETKSEGDTPSRS